MLCNSCSKLSILVSTRTCMRCKGIINNNLSCICDNCSNEQKVCSICLKKNNPKPKSTTINSGCGSCGKKK